MRIISLYIIYFEGICSSFFCLTSLIYAPCLMCFFGGKTHCMFQFLIKNKNLSQRRVNQNVSFNFKLIKFFDLLTVVKNLIFKCRFKLNILNEIVEVPTGYQSFIRILVNTNKIISQLNKCIKVNMLHLKFLQH